MPTLQDLAATAQRAVKDRVMFIESHASLTACTRSNDNGAASHEHNIARTLT